MTIQHHCINPSKTRELFHHFHSRRCIDSEIVPILDMCYREVQCTKHYCGHHLPHAEIQVDCKSARCRYSASHLPTCRACLSTCQQWLRPARTIITRTSETSCFHCKGRKL